jgi:hypothetical protein
MAWREMLYRVRRREHSDAGDQELIDRFHDLQEKIDYFRGWIGSESVHMQGSYDRLVAEIKGKTCQPIQEAWAETGRRSPQAATLPSDEHPDVSKASERFLADVRFHLSLKHSIPVVRKRQSAVKVTTPEQGGSDG